ncbi:MAG: AAA domain-containing protein [Oscillospiraceae bacterium]|nr:AAA domain-containing protein [Oscillospiraceae bacterium]
MDKSKHLILVKGEDKTERIRSINQQNGRTAITFTNGKTYSYANENVEHIRSSLAQQKSRDCFSYLKRLAQVDKLCGEDGKSILGKRYDNVHFVRDDSMLGAFLSGELPTSSSLPRAATIYPFGFNASQKVAVEQALGNALSIIEGPPGTGKTQTILNIIANAVMNGESVAVVSGNNYATKNVQEKLQKNGVEFISAYLGNQQNKDEFVKGQTTHLDIAAWAMQAQEQQLLRQKLHTQFVQLQDLLKNKNELAVLQQELKALEQEQRYFVQYYTESFQASSPFPQHRTFPAQTLLELWLLFETYAEREQKINWLAKLNLYFRFGLRGKAFFALPVEQMIAVCQKEFYSHRLAELRLEIAQLNDALANADFHQRMEEYTAHSMRLFQAKLSEKYQTNPRKKYQPNDLWKNAQAFIQDYPVILSTVHSLRSSLSDQVIYDYVIVDEASQVDLAAGALALSCAKKAVIVGDLKQLPPVIDSAQKKIADDIFSEFQLPNAYRYSDHSLLLSLSELFPQSPKTLLREHYRCHPQIIGFCNQKFYDNQLIVLTKAKSNQPPFAVYQTVPGDHSRRGSRLNQRQIDVIEREVLLEQQLDPQQESIGIITPYRNQMDALQDAFAERGIQAATVDKFQGQERDVVILSTVDNEITEFTDDANRLNVAISRAINQLVLVINGNKERQDTNISDLIRYIRYHKNEVINSQVYSIFDYLFKAYAEQKRAFLTGRKRISKYDSENLANALIEDVLTQERFHKYDVVAHVPLRMLLRSTERLIGEQLRYASLPLTHVDFLIFNKMDKTPVVAVEVDGVTFHKPGSKQAERDAMKNAILQAYDIPLLRLRTDESSERERLETALSA